MDSDPEKLLERLDAIRILLESLLARCDKSLDILSGSW